MRDHLMGYPAVVAQIDEILSPQPAWLNWVDWIEVVRPLPLLMNHTPADDAAKTAEHDKANAPKPVKREEPYRPEFDFSYVDRKGHEDKVIPKRTEVSAFINCTATFGVETVHINGLDYRRGVDGGAEFESNRLHNLWDRSVMTWVEVLSHPDRRRA